MGITQTVHRQLVFFTAVFFQLVANLVCQVERIAEDRKGHAVLLQQSQQLPKVRMQDRIAAGDVEIGQAVIDLAKVQAVIESVLHLCPGHGIQLLVAVF